MYTYETPVRTQTQPFIHFNNQQNGGSANNNANPADIFQKLLDEYEPVSLQRGQYVEGRVVQIDGNSMLVDVAAKRTAIIPPQDLSNISEEELAKISEGDEVFLYVLRTPVGDDDLLVSLQKGLQYQDWADAESHMEEETLLKLELLGHNKGGLIAKFGHLRGFIPNSHIPALQSIYDRNEMARQKAKMVGEELLLKVIEVNPDRKRLVLSAKAAQKERRGERLLELKLKEGETIQGRITNLVKFGAFVELGGVEGLVHISEIDWDHVEKPADYLSKGEEIEVLIQSVDIEKERISLSRKALLPNPWQAFANAHQGGELIEGVVTSVLDFGAFLMVEDGIEGLLHVSEMHGARDSQPADILQPGDLLLVRIIGIEPDRERLSLSQRRVSREDETEWIWQRQQAQQQAAEALAAAEADAEEMSADE